MNRKIAFIISCLLLLYIYLPAQPKIKSDNLEKLPVYECNRINSEINLTGKVTDPLWKQANTAKLADPISGQPGKFNTTVKLLYNSKYLYIAFECVDDSIWGTITGRDSAIFTEECVEIFICPSGKTRQYYELNVSPRNAIFDAYIINGRSESGEKGIGMRTWKDFTCEGMETKVNINIDPIKKIAKSWTVEYAIPFTSIIGSDNLVPLPGEEWRINFYRIDSPVKGKLEFYSWSPTGANDFHRFWKFGYLKFSGN
jgi:hypothetical protein